MKKTVYGIARTLISIVTLLLWFLKIFADEGLMQDPVTGEIKKYVFTHSIFENMSTLAHPFVVKAAISFTIVCIAVNFTGLFFPRNKKLYVAANVVFILNVAAFVVVLIAASTVARGY